MPSLTSLLIQSTDFVEKDIFSLLGLQDIEQKQKDDLLELILDTITNRVIARILDDLEEEKQKEFETVIERDNEQEISAFFLDNKINYTQLFAEEAVLYKAEMVSIIANPENAQQFLEKK